MQAWLRTAAHGNVSGTGYAKLELCKGFHVHRAQVWPCTPRSGPGAGHARPGCSHRRPGGEEGRWVGCVYTRESRHSAVIFVLEHLNNVR